LYVIVRNIDIGTVILKSEKIKTD